MTGKGNRFGIGPVDLPSAGSSRRQRDPGPMGVAVREVAASAQEASDALVEQRRQNAQDAREFRAAREEGRVILSLPLDSIGVSALPRDRLDLEAVAASDAMEELKASIRERGQREPVEVFVGDDGQWQLKAGWRRVTALRQLQDETGDPRFRTVLARVSSGGGDRADLYLDMVEENVIREDLSFAEMAQIALELARDPLAGIASADDAVNRLYRALHKVKRSYIRAFVVLMHELDGSLPFPRALARDLGVEVSRRISSASPEERRALRLAVAGCEDEAAQTRVLNAFARPLAPLVDRPAQGRKLEFRVGDSKITARTGEIRIKAPLDFVSLDRAQLERAIQAFNAVLKG